MFVIFLFISQKGNQFYIQKYSETSLGQFLAHSSYIHICIKGLLMLMLFLQLGMAITPLCDFGNFEADIAENFRKSGQCLQLSCEVTLNTIQHRNDSILPDMLYYILKK